jgi:hypothetical protein
MDVSGVKGLPQIASAPRFRPVQNGGSRVYVANGGAYTVSVISTG